LALKALEAIKVLIFAMATHAHTHIHTHTHLSDDECNRINARFHCSPRSLSRHILNAGIFKWSKALWESQFVLRLMTTFNKIYTHTYCKCK